jgi:hypothetical protein
MQLEAEQTAICGLMATLGTARPATWPIANVERLRLIVVRSAWNRTVPSAF